MRGLWAALALVWLGGVAQAQEARADSDITACLLVQQGLTPTYREALEETCLRLAGETCARTEWPLACLDELQDALRGAFILWRPLMPETLDGTQFSQRTYPNRLAQVDAVFATPCPPQNAGLGIEACETTRLFSALTGLLAAARVAEVRLR